MCHPDEIQLCIVKMKKREKKSLKFIFRVYDFEWLTKKSLSKYNSVDVVVVVCRIKSSKRNVGEKFHYYYYYLELSARGARVRVYVCI